MKWNWQHKNWPTFTYNSLALKELEERFIIESARLVGASTIITKDEKRSFTIDLMSEEALKSSLIEGEILRRDSVISSLLRQMGLAPNYSDHQANDKEKGIAALMVNNFQTFDQPLTRDMLFKWHQCVVGGKHYLHDIGQYRTSEDPMQVVSGYEGNYTVHFVAPPAAIVSTEMDAFVDWFNDTAPEGSDPLPALTRASIAHVYFVSIHPFEDGNGRIGRALSEKAMAQTIGRPALLALSNNVEKTRKDYYSQLESNQKGIAIDSWLSYFAHTMLDAVGNSQRLVRFIVEKSRLYDRVRGQINERQEKVLLRLFAEGMDGFKGGLNADKYMKITGTIRQNAARDLRKLVDCGVLTKTGKLKGTRYWLNIGAEFEDEKKKCLLEQKSLGSS